MMLALEGQSMIQGYARTVSLTTFAALFGIVQMFCACLAASASVLPTEMTHAVQMDHGQMDHRMGHDHGAAHEENLPAPSRSHGDHDKGNGCEHCDGDTVMAMAAGFASSLAQFTPAPEKMIVNIFASVLRMHADLVPDMLMGLRWLDPPHETPVTLKIRLLN